MILSVKHFEGYFEKIAMSVTRTIHSERENADLQPLDLNRRSISTPQDKPHSIRQTKKNMSMSHLEDRRMTHDEIGKRHGSYF